MIRRGAIVWILAMAIVTLVASACASGGSEEQGSDAEGTTIGVRDYEFEPGTATVDVGDTVTWVWDGRAPHNVVGEGFRSTDQSTGTFRHTFDQPGTYPYACTIHPGMEGNVVVEAGSG